MNTSTKSYVVVFCTLPVSENARPFAKNLVEKRLAACVNIIPQIESIYHWEGKIEEGKEQLLILKTDSTHLDDLMEEMRAHHPYQVPEILALPVQKGSPDYLKWISESLL